MKNIAILFTISLGLLMLAYGIATGDKAYGNVVLALTLLSILTFLTTMSIYEIKSSDQETYKFLRKVLSKGYLPYILLTIPLAVGITLLTIPLTCPLELNFFIKIPIYSKAPIVEVRTTTPIVSKYGHGLEIEVYRVYEVVTSQFISLNITLPLTSILLSALFLTYVTRIFNSLKMRIVWLITLPLIWYFVFFGIPSLTIVLTHGVQSLGRIAIFLTTSSITTSILVTCFASIYTILISTIKKLYKVQ